MAYQSENQYDIRYDDLFAELTSGEYNKLVADKKLVKSPYIKFTVDESILDSEKCLIKISDKSRTKVLRESELSVYGNDVHIFSDLNIKDLLVYKDGLFYPIKARKERLSESFVKVFEERGITSNIENIIQYVSEVIWRYGSNYPNFNKYGYETEFNGLKRDQNGRPYTEITFKIPDKINTAEWMLPGITFTVKKYVYQSTDDYEQNYIDQENIGIYSYVNTDIDSSGPDIYGGMECVVSYIKGASDFYIGETLIEKESNLYRFIRHELNHIREMVYPRIKNNDIWLHDKERYSKIVEKDKKRDFAYTDLVNVKNARRTPMFAKKLANALYMYCVPEEQQANIEQFYQESDKDKFSDSKIYNRLSFFKSFVNNSLAFKPTDSQVNLVYSTFSGIIRRLFKFGDENPVRYYPQLLKFIKRNLEDVEQRIIRANKVTRHPIVRESNIIRY